MRSSPAWSECSRSVMVSWVSGLDASSRLLSLLPRLCSAAYLGEVRFNQVAHILRQVKVLQTLTLLQVHQLCDALKEETYEAGQYIITQGEVGLVEN